MIVVLAMDRATALTHCRELGIPPYARDTVIPSTPNSTCGLRLTRDDKILVCRTFHGHRYALEIMRELERSVARSPGIEPGSRLRLGDIWEDVKC